MRSAVCSNKIYEMTHFKNIIHKISPFANILDPPRLKGVTGKNKSRRSKSDLINVCCNRKAVMNIFAFLYIAIKMYISYLFYELVGLKSYYNKLNLC